nr:alpha/beta hydrolase [Allomuricauda sp.]
MNKSLEIQKFTLQIAFLFFFAIGVYSQKTESEIILETESGNITGSLLYAPVPKKIPIALIIPGSGPTDRNGNNPMMTNNHLKMLAEGLFENGIASLRYDKRGIGASSMKGLQESKLRFEDYVNDASAWVDLLKSDDRFSEIVVIGHSEGSLVGILASQNEDVAKFISVAGAGQKAADLLKEQLRSQPPMVLAQCVSIIEKLEDGKTVENVPQMLQSLFRPSVQPYLISWFTYDPQKEITKLKIPILIIQGTTDIQVSVSDAEKLSLANKKAQLHILEGMNHILKEAESDRLKNIQTYSMPDLTLKPGLLKVISEFVLNKNDLSKN